MKKTRYFMTVAIVGLMISISNSQALAIFDNYGTFVPRSDVTQALESYQIDPNLNYYFFGTDMWPDAIIGVNNAYTLNSKSWKKIEATPEALKKLVSGMKSRPETSPLFGFAILDNKKQQIGVWYSMMGILGYVRMEGERSVYIAPPNLLTRPEMIDG